VARPRQARDKAAKEVNAKLLAEGRKNQCSFKTDSDELAAGCDKKLKNLANALVEAKKRLSVRALPASNSRFPATPDSSGKAEHNKELSGKRAAAIERELVARGSPRARSWPSAWARNRPLVKPDNTPAKKAKNRRYEIQVHF